MVRFQMKTRYMMLLSDPELKAIGKITYYWSAIDDQWSRNSVWCAHNNKVPLPKHFRSPSFEKRVKAWIEWCDLAHEFPEDSKSKIIALGDKLIHAYDERRKFLHWVSYRSMPPSKILFLSGFLRGEEHHITSLAEMEEFADHLSVLAAEVAATVDLYSI